MSTRGNSGAGSRRSVAGGTTLDMSEIHPRRLFTGSCLGLIATAFGFAVTADILGDLKAQFLLSNAQAGWIGGVGLWGFTIAIFVFGPLVDALGMRLQLRLALLGHIVGSLVMMSATFFRESGQGFWVLLLGGLILAMGNGLIEAVCNPLVATVYPDRKTEKLNQFHVWFPGGIFIGGLLCYFMTQAGIGWWQLKLALIIVPAVIYGYLFTAQRFPQTERVQSGLSFGEMVRATFGRPLFIILLLCMGITASVELGPNRWIPSVYAAVGIAGILMLAWINGLMAVMRYFAGHAIERLKPTGILLMSAIIASIGLYALSLSTTRVVAFVAATVFAIGVCYFWPTMLGVTSERVPKGGALALGLMGGFGNLIVGALTIPMMGDIADRYVERRLDVEQARAVLQRVVEVFPAPAEGKKPSQYLDTEKAHVDAENALNLLNQDAAAKDSILASAAALRSAAGAAVVGLDETTTQQVKAVADEAGQVIGPEDNYGGRMSFRYLVPFALILVLVFGSIYLRDRARGGYRIERLVDAPEGSAVPH